MLDEFKGKLVKVYPHDTCAKFGVFLDYNENGILIKVNGNKSEDQEWKSNDGKVFFIAFSARLMFIEA